MISKMITNWKIRRGLNRRYNQTVNELNSMSSRDLADIGIHRSQIEQIAADTVYGAR